MSNHKQLEKWFMPFWFDLQIMYMFVESIVLCMETIISVITIHEYILE